ncbi:MAG: hypothetical protein GY849_21110 [Deltaproteobacteria bacterium]|nr:hypothetical protein [Deltaproteobacteria bacterium]
MDELLKEHGDKYLELLPKVRNRGFQDTDKFETAIDSKEWFNRTVYTADEAAELDIRKFMMEDAA